MITYNEPNFLRKESLNKEITFSKKVKSKSFIIGFELNKYKLLI